MPKSTSGFSDWSTLLAMKDDGQGQLAYVRAITIHGCSIMQSPRFTSHYSALIKTCALPYLDYLEWRPKDDPSEARDIEADAPRGRTVDIAESGTERALRLPPRHVDSMSGSGSTRVFCGAAVRPRYPLPVGRSCHHLLHQLTR